MRVCGAPNEFRVYNLQNRNTISMPKHDITALDRAKEFSSNGLYSTDRSVLFCKYCNCRVSWDRRDSIMKHINSEKHKTSLTSSTSTVTLQQTIGGCAQLAKKRKTAADRFAMETTEAFVKANIPLQKLQDPSILSWMNKYIEGLYLLQYLANHATYLLKCAVWDHIKDIRTKLLFLITSKRTNY